eukprot:12219463-Alexandrium_andersonii.AAC.1
MCIRDRAWPAQSPAWPRTGGQTSPGSLLVSGSSERGSGCPDPCWAAGWATTSSRRSPSTTPP